MLRAALNKNNNHSEHFNLEDSLNKNELISCPSCKRTFNQSAAENHIPTC